MEEFTDENGDFGSDKYRREKLTNTHRDLGCKYQREELLTNELVPQPIPLFQLGRRDDQTVDEGKKNRPEHLNVVKNTQIQEN